MYAKVFRGLWEGSLCGQSDAQLVFIFLLAYADSDGHVRSAPHMVGALTGLGPDRVMAALAILEADDPLTTSPEEHGKRIVRVSEGWDWQITNYAKYRKMRDNEDRLRQNRESQQRFRDKSKQPSAGVSQAKPRSSQGEGEVEVEGEVEGASIPKDRTLSPKSKPKRSTGPGGFNPLLIEELQAKHPGVNVPLAAEKLDNSTKKYRNRDRALRNWCASAQANGWDKLPRPITFGDDDP